jgi:hypothetical protein
MMIPSIFSRLLAYDFSLRTFTKSFHGLFGTEIVDSTRRYEHHTSPDGVQLAIPVSDQLSQNRLVDCRRTTCPGVDIRDHSAPAR